MGRPKGTTGGENAKAKLIDAAGRSFRTGGFGGAGIDGLAKQAGLTSGAFYAHFGSKADAFRLAVVEGLKYLQQGVEHIAQQQGDNWKNVFIDFYLGERLCVGLDEACALPTFSTDVARADEATRLAYESALLDLVNAVATGLSQNPPPTPDAPSASERAWSLLAILSGAASIARATPSPAAREQIIAAARHAARQI